MFAVLLLVVIGLVAGIINTIAGGGSFLVLPVLVALGLPAGVANGTSRVGLVLQNVSSTWTFHRSGVRDYAVVLRLSGPMCVGAILGAYLATRLSDELLRPLFGWILLAWAIVLMLRPDRFVRVPTEPMPLNVWAYLAALAIGWYGGFLQAGVGFPLMALLVTALGYAPVRANGLKVVLVLAYTMFVLPIFGIAGQIVWPEAMSLATGNLVGGWLGTKWQLRAGARLVHWFVLVAVVASGSLMAFG